MEPVDSVDIFAGAPQAGAVRGGKPAETRLKPP